jgi:mannose-6-phosphate isomerase-like protein (cupin superfamily)
MNNLFLNYYLRKYFMIDKKQVFNDVALTLLQLGFSITSIDAARPWGGFYVINETQAAKFAQHFFPEEDLNQLKITNKLSPKILIVEPGHRLSWQYHRRRAEIWKCTNGPVAVMTSNTDEEDVRHTLKAGDIIKLRQGERHRLIGLDDWGIVAEIWQHTDESNPSDENDIVRLQDDYSRK